MVEGVFLIHLPPLRTKSRSRECATERLAVNSEFADISLYPLFTSLFESLSVLLFAKRSQVSINSGQV